MRWPWSSPTESQPSDLPRLIQTVVELQGRVDQLEGRVAEAQFRYLEALDKVIGRLQGRLARRMRDESHEDAPGPTNGDEEAPQYPTVSIPPKRALRRF